MPRAKYSLTHTWYANGAAAGAAVNKTWALPFDAVLVRVDEQLQIVSPFTAAVGESNEAALWLVSIGGVAGLADKLSADSDMTILAGEGIIGVPLSNDPTNWITHSKVVEMEILVKRGLQVRGTYVPSTQVGIRGYTTFHYYPA